VLRYTPSPDSLGGVEDIETDELLIPRITPYPPIKTANVLKASLTANVVTLTTTAAHNMLPGETIEVTAVTPTTYNGQYVIVATPLATTLTYAKTAGNLTEVTLDPTGKVATVNLPESEVDYPDIDEDERMHDGLWVIADGGLLGT
jgi:hypothetical protein